MNTSTRPLRIFVAMPGTQMGEKASWKNPEEIKKSFLTPVCQRLRTALKRKVDLIIEKDKDTPGTIYRSMFQEAWDADVYVADLTGANANVYLELGVRWAVRDGVTIIVCQELSEIKFNAAASRAIPYGANPTVNETAIEKVVRAILAGLSKEDHCDSPVREGSQLKVITTEEYENLNLELKRLQSERGEELLAAAKKEAEYQKKISLLRQAISINPVFLDAYLELGTTLRIIGQYGEAIKVLREAIKLNPDCTDCHRELGVALSKNDDLDLAAESLQAAIQRNPRDYDALSVLGGVYRRLGMKEAPTTFDWPSLREARNFYQKASEINPHDTYPLLNVARLDLLLSKVEPARKQLAKQAFDELQDLCSYEVRKAEKALGENKTNPQLRAKVYWRTFDHADTILLSDRIDEGLARYRAGIELIHPDERESVLSSVSAPLRNYLAADVLSKSLNDAVKNLIEEIDIAKAKS